MKSYLILGASGMAGHMITAYLMESGENVEAVARKKLEFCMTHVLDVKDTLKLGQIILNGNYDVVVNAIGILNRTADVNKAETVFLNSYLPHWLEMLLKETNTKLIHISTDCVFSGQKGNYKEDDVFDGQSFYDRSKALGEVAEGNTLTFRQSIIGPEIKKDGMGLFHWFMQENDMIQGYTKTVWSGVTTLVLAKAIRKAVEKNLHGLYQLSSNTKISKCDLVKIFNSYTRKGLAIEEVDGMVQDKSLVNTRNDFDFFVPSYEEQIEEMLDWIKCHPNLYEKIYPIFFGGGVHNKVFHCYSIPSKEVLVA